MMALNVEALRKPMEATHASGVNYTYKWRVSQLKALKRMIINHKEEWVSAVFTDLHKDATETEMVELLTITSEIDYILARLKSWMKPESVPGPYYQIVGFASVQRKPLCQPGVLVIAPFNYPLQLAILPVVGSLAGGNPTVLKPSELTPTVSALMAKLVPQYLEPGAVQGASTRACVYPIRKQVLTLTSHQYSRRRGSRRSDGIIKLSMGQGCLYWIGASRKGLSKSTVPCVFSCVCAHSFSILLDHFRLLPRLPQRHSLLLSLSWAESRQCWWTKRLPMTCRLLPIASCGARRSMQDKRCVCCCG